MARRLYVIAGHGAGDSGAVGNGYQEQERVRVLAQRIADLGGEWVTLHPFSNNAYASGALRTLSIPEGCAVVELHMDSAGAGARGGHVIIKGGFDPDEHDEALAKLMRDMFPGRANSLVGRSDLANVNIAASRGINYRLVENGFISNAGDVATFNANIDALARGYLAAFGIGAAAAPSVTVEQAEAKVDRAIGYVVRVTADVLNVREGAGTAYAVATTVTKGEAFTITAEARSEGSVWGQLKSGAGWICLDYTEPVSEAHKAAEKAKSVDDVAREVIEGKYGNGSDRKRSLEAAGYDYATVQARVNALLGSAPATVGKSVDQLASEVINGDWGNGEERRQRLIAAGYDYNAVQARVNQLL